MLESPPPPPSPFPPNPSASTPPPSPLPTAPGLRHSRLYDITFLTPRAARSTAGTLLLGRGRFAATVETAEFELRGVGKVSLRCPGMGKRALGNFGDVVKRATGCQSGKGKGGGSAPFSFSTGHTRRSCLGLVWVWLILGTLYPQSNLSNLFSLFLKAELCSHVAFVCSQHPGAPEQVVLGAPREVPRIWGRAGLRNSEGLIWEAQPLTTRTRYVTREAT